MTNNVPNKVPSANVVQGTLPVLTEDNPDTIFLAPNKYLKLKNGSVNYDNYLSNMSAASISSVSESQTDINKLITTGATTVPLDQRLQIDTVDLTDIESITYEQYYDAVSKLVKYKAIIKIRNSSKDKTEVQGVDARVYNPNA